MALNGRNSGSVIPTIERAFSHSVGRTLRGKVVFEDLVHHISGKIAKKFRTIYNYMKATGLKYTSVHGERSSQPGSNELKARERFAAVAKAVRLRRGNLSLITQDQENFLAQKDTAGGKKTMKAYLWKVCGEEYDAQH